MDTGLSYNIPLVLDLDGTLLRVDSSRHFLKEACLAGDANIFAAFWKGVPWLKAYLASRYAHTLAPSYWNEPLMRIAEAYRERGAEVWLVTASHVLLAKKVFHQFSFLTHFAGSTRLQRLKGATKARWLNARFGTGGYDYAGDCANDVPCWNSARIAWLPAGLPASVRKRIHDATIREY
ncbi:MULTISPECIES: haloacid dehalogenase-like hydrolase [unclassified Desulfovibrio]|uniref:haloacid dehalogenase-like hydrolase n=1 Tax=unclassified Desulfovibrio TaxID=2593640 RepID=UPI0013EA53C3|nr:MULTISPECIES: haloacid dehalogenase-like hydrolase [unclassified Desulfovibrio]